MQKCQRTLYQRIKQLSRLKKVTLFTVVAFILYTFIGFLVLPPIIRVSLEKKLPPLLKRHVSVSRVRLNPLTLSATIEGFRILQRDAGKANTLTDLVILGF